MLLNGLSPIFWNLSKTQIILFIKIKICWSTWFMSTFLFRLTSILLDLVPFFSFPFTTLCLLLFLPLASCLLSDVKCLWNRFYIPKIVGWKFCVYNDGYLILLSEFYQIYIQINVRNMWICRPKFTCTHEYVRTIGHEIVTGHTSSLF